MKPIIAVTTYGRFEKDISTAWYKEHYSLPALYVDAVRRAGGIPLLLPPGEKYIAKVLARVDGVLVTGGADIYPTEYFGNSEHQELTELDAERDETELALIHYLVDESELPTLCICRGMQVLNVALGGTLHEHIADSLTEDIHRGEDGGWTTHSVIVLPASLPAKAMQTDLVSTYSGHHQAIKELAPDLRVSAIAPDGVIEAVEHSELPWIFGVQWHPEITAASDPTQQRLFDALVQEADRQS